MTDLGALRIRSDALDAGKGLKWPLGTLKPGTYLLTESSGNLTDHNVYVAVFDQSGNRLQYVDAQNHANRTFTLREATDCTLGVYGKADSTGKSCDIVLLPMLVDVKETVTAWQPPATLDAKAIVGGPTMNLLRNPSFEDGLTGWTSSTPGALTTVDSEPDNGIKSAKDGRLYLKNSNNGITRAVRSSTFNVIPGATLKVSAWGTSPVTGRVYSLAISFDGADPIIVTNKVLATTGVWTEIAGTITVPAAATEAQLLLYGSEWSRWDLASVTEVI